MSFCANSSKENTPVLSENSCGGVVRLTNHELADHDRSRHSRGELTPFSERGSTVLFEDVAAVDVAVLVLGTIPRYPPVALTNVTEVVP